MSGPNLSISQRWIRRAHFPGTLAAPLGWGSEIWRPASQLPGYAALMAGSARAGIPVSPIYELTTHLIDEVLEAAAAVVYASDRIRRAMSRANAWVKAHPLPEQDPPPEYGTHYSHPGVAETYTEFANLVVWVRATEDRVTRGHPGGGQRGLLPALRKDSTLARETGHLLARYRSDIAREARWFANYSIHESRLPYPLANSAEFKDGRLHARIPDVLPGPIESIFDLTYQQGRTADAFALAARTAVRELIDGLLDAFEREAPARLRLPNSGPAPAPIHFDPT